MYAVEPRELIPESRAISSLKRRSPIPRSRGLPCPSNGCSPPRMMRSTCSDFVRRSRSSRTARARGERLPTDSHVASRARPAAAKAVFINCPFDDQFKPILRAMVFTIILSGYHPRCALDMTDGAEVRVGRSLNDRRMRWVIHDLSRVDIAGGVPRFNMAMELGLHLGAASSANPSIATSAP